MLAVFACTAFALALFVAVYLAIPPMRARRDLEKWERIQIGKSTFSQAQTVAAQFEGRTGTCSPVECGWIFGTSNFALPDWWRGKGQALAVQIHVKDGLVDRKELMYWIGEGSMVSAVNVTETGDWPGNLKEPRWTKIEGTQGVHYIVRVNISPSDSANVRKRYTSFNWNCMWQYQGCKDEHELMPTADW